MNPFVYVAGQFHALIQYPDTLIATTAKAVSGFVLVVCSVWKLNIMNCVSHHTCVYCIVGIFRGGKFHGLEFSKHFAVESSCKPSYAKLEMGEYKGNRLLLYMYFYS